MTVLFYIVSIQAGSLQHENVPSLDSTINEKVPKILQDSNLRVEVVANRLEFPTSMTFIGPDEILVSEKNSSNLKRIINGTKLQEFPLNVTLARGGERGMLGIAVDNYTRNDTKHTYVFVYLTESSKFNDSTDDCPPPEPYYCDQEKEPTGNRLYRYELVNDKLIKPKLLLDLPAEPGPNHNGGVVLIGPDDNVYTAIGDLTQKNRSQAQNVDNGIPPDGTSGILMVRKEPGSPQNLSIGDGTNSNYYAYGIRNSFGIDFDPVTGYLWDTENGPAYGDEINLVQPGFNSGWSKVQGIWEPRGFEAGNRLLNPDNALVHFAGKGRYSAPEMIWKNSVGLTALKFIDSNKYGKDYQNDMLVGDYNNGNIYHFDLNNERTALVLTGKLSDKIADTTDEINESNLIFGKGFGGITDIEVGPYDGYLYVVSIVEGKIFRIVPGKQFD